MSEYLDIVKAKLVQDGKPVAFLSNANADVLNLLTVLALAEAAERQAAALEKIAAKLDAWDNADRHGNFAGLKVATMG